MSIMKVESSLNESFGENMEFNLKSLSDNNASQNASLCRGFDQSSSCLTQQDQRNNLGETKDHGLPSSFEKGENSNGIIAGTLVEKSCNKVPGLTKNMISNDYSCNQGATLSEVHVDDENGVIEPIVLKDISSTTNGGQCVGVTNIFGKQEDISSGFNSSHSGLFVKREVHGGSRQSLEVGNSLSINPLVQFDNTSSSHTLPVPCENLSHVNNQEHSILRSEVGLSVDSHFCPHLSTNFHPERPQENFNLGLNSTSQRNTMQLNPFASEYYPMQLPTNSYQSLLPMGVNNDVYIHSSIPNMVVVVPSASQNLTSPLLPLPINSNLSTSEPVERRLFSDQGLLYHPQQHNLDVGGYGALNDASNHPMVYNPSFEEWSSLPWDLQSTNQAQGQQVEPSYPPWFPTPWNTYGQGSLGVGNVGSIPCPYPNTYDHLLPLDLLPHFGHSDPGLNPDSSSSLISPSNHNRGSLEVTHTSQSEEAITEEREPRPIPEGVSAEIRDIIRREFTDFVVSTQEWAYYRQFEQPTLERPGHYTLRTEFGFPEGSLLIQSYAFTPTNPLYANQNIGFTDEELAYLRETYLDDLESMETNSLTEDTIMELLKRKSYEIDISDPTLDAEICCICKEEYVQGEDIGALFCRHYFHTECIKPWLLIKNRCPVCKKKGLHA